MPLVLSGDGAITGMVSADSSDLSTELDAKLDTPGAWTAYTPTLLNMTLGNGTVTAAYSQVGKIVSYRAKVVLGSTSSISADAAIGGPVTPKVVVSNADAWIGNAAYIDVSASQWYQGFTKGVYLGYPGLYGYVAATVPFTWASGDVIHVNGTYEAA